MAGNGLLDGHERFFLSRVKKTTHVSRRLPNSQFSLEAEVCGWQTLEEPSDETRRSQRPSSPGPPASVRMPPAFPHLSVGTAGQTRDDSRSVQRVSTGKHEPVFSSAAPLSNFRKGSEMANQSRYPRSVRRLMSRQRRRLLRRLRRTSGAALI